MPQTYLLDGAEWRAFRLFLIDLEDRELDRIQRQLRREVAARQERESDITRLFFSSLHRRPTWRPLNKPFARNAAHE